MLEEIRNLTSSELEEIWDEIAPPLSLEDEIRLRYFMATHIRQWYVMDEIIKDILEALIPIPVYLLSHINQEAPHEHLRIAISIKGLQSFCEKYHLVNSRGKVTDRYLQSWNRSSISRLMTKGLLKPDRFIYLGQSLASSTYDKLLTPPPTEWLRSILYWEQTA